MDLAIEEGMRQKPALSNSSAPRNAHPFIFRLPTEILEDIFTLTQCGGTNHRGRYNRSLPAVPSQVNISYVCRHWRHVALNCATMWTNRVSTTSQRWTEELLARSRQASLKIHIGFFRGFGSGSQQLNTLETVMDHLERIQELCLDLPPPYEQVLSKLSSPAPRLQTLDIQLQSDSLPEWPLLLFAGVPPPLRTLRLIDCWVPLSSFKLNALTTLGLYCIPVRFQQNIEQFLAVMGNMKKLEHLYLVGALASVEGFLSSAVFRTFKKIDLPHLSYIQIDDSVSTTIALFSCVNIPSRTTVELEPMAEVDTPFHNYAVLYSLFTQRCSVAENHALSSSTILSLNIEFIEERLGGTLAFSAASNIPLRIHCDLTDDNWDSEPLISNICGSMPLSNVRSLRILQPPFSPTFWRNMLGQLRDIRYIDLRGGCMPDLSVLSLTDLTTDEGVRHQYGDRGQSDMLAPNLEELVLDRIEFCPAGDSDPPKPAITRRSLLDALSTRQGTHGRLTMTNCTIGDSDEFDSVMVWGDGRICVVSDSWMAKHDWSV